MASLASAWARFPQFLASGGLSTLVHWAVMAAMMAAGGAASSATAVGAAAGALANFVLQRRYVFPRKRPAGAALAPYVLAMGFTGVFNVGCFSVLYHVGHVPAGSAQFVATVATAVLNYHILRTKVYA
ncbi:GtrA family protein [Bordetella genomosp. 13]|uniref:GtrA/DPMS transmembrane domain-containing protein n=1 Tax=Bordetella genomosp. 13 TaxID=463040 RepID=A0A1W6Z7C5_9BORD|nr:GtrA family protein [Bordetella genomosp. 13]ARP93162.1 hypothetical protein CAL15_01430 [Bordetella genomosp. 13]